MLFVWMEQEICTYVDIVIIVYYAMYLMEPSKSITMDSDWSVASDILQMSFSVGVP